MIISVYGAGYVGLVSAACLAKLGHLVICADINEQRITKLSEGQCPIHEQDLPELLQAQLASGRLRFSADLAFAIREASIHLIATGTPSLADGQADLSQVFAAATKIAEETSQDCMVVIKSTVPVGTGDAIQAHVDKELLRCGKSLCVLVAANPEFLREGTAVYDFLNADRVIIGGEQEALSLLETVYLPLTKEGVPLLKMSRRSAELTKYAANAMLACKISFINQISQLAQGFGANIEEIAKGIALDHRIGPHFLQAGVGYGGSCFPKDLRALIQTAKMAKIDSCLLDAIESINHLQKNWIFERLQSHFNHRLNGLTVGIWGLSFKPGTDDIREASSLVAIKALLDSGIELRVFDPVAMGATQQLFDGNLALSWSDSQEAIFEKKLDALVIATEWPQFKNYQLELLKSQLGEAPLFDGRNCFELSAVRRAQLAYYYSVGRPTIVGKGYTGCN